MKLINKKFAAVLSLCILCTACKTTKPADGSVNRPAVSNAGAKAVTLPEEVNLLRERALAARQEALSMKADKAVKDEYARAVDVFQQGEMAVGKKKWKDANGMYTQAADEFSSAAKIAREKRELAEFAYRDANAAILEARRKALETESTYRDAGMEPDFSAEASVE
ncbi:MAG: hypothetical protein LBG74_00935 [Spirochaetaceae bacterium]|jgi:hypothetical protein|nr:hypothetical protein [Spirochaetaceae bacterium]